MQQISSPCVAPIRAYLVAIFVTSFVMASLAQERARAYRLGLQFIDAPTESPPPFLRDFEPFPIVDPANFFVSQGALVGWTEIEVQRAIALAVADVVNSIDVGYPSRCLDVSIHLGPAPSSLPGQRLNLALGQSSGFITALGETPRPGDYDNFTANDTLVAAVYLDNIDNLGASLVTYDTASDAINAIAGTAAHEIGHVFGAEHVSTSADAPQPLPIMAVEGTGLPTAARLTARRFSNLQPEPVSNSELLVASMGTAVRGDFNFDSAVDEEDLAILLANVGMSDRLRSEGDATGDHWVDGADAAYLIANWTAGPFAGSAVHATSSFALAMARSSGQLYQVPEADAGMLLLMLAASVLASRAASPGAGI